MNEENNGPQPQQPQGGQPGTANSGGPDMSHPDNKKVMAVLAYLGPLVIVSYLMAKDDPTVKFHIKQGLVLVVMWVALFILGIAMPFLFLIIPLLNLAILVFAIIGIVNVIQGHEKELPVVGGFGKYFHI